jgi:periplasmic divalent cation tolerance protein
MSYGIVLVTTKDVSEAEKIARGILDRKAAACCNIVKDVRSLYWWQGKIEDSPEVILVIKTRRDMFPEIVRTVKSLHSYSVPEIVMLPIVEGSEDYLKWVNDSLEKA